MRVSSSRACEETLAGGFRAIVLENDVLSLTVLPDKGADIYRLIYKPEQIDVLWKSPIGLRPAACTVQALSEQAWLECYEGGWQELFPNGGDDTVYKGASLGFHGEASVASWCWKTEHGAGWAAVDLQLRLRRSPFTLSRRMILEDGKPLVRIEEEIVNLSPEDMHFMWGHHPALGAPFLDDTCVIQLPPATFQAHSAEICPLSRIAPGTTAQWPIIPGKTGPVDLSVIPPSSGKYCEFGYLRDLEAGWYAVTSRRHNFSFALSWPIDVFPYLWFWQELGGSFGFPYYGQWYVNAIEPLTSYPSGLNNAIAAGTAPLLKGGARIQVDLAMMFLPGQRAIRSIAVDGAADFEDRPCR